MTAALALKPAAPERDPHRWYLVATNAKQEKLAAFHLRRLGVEVYLPLRIVKLIAPTKHVGSTPLFPRYVFIRVDPAVAPWWSIRSAIGVSSIVSQGERPAMLPAGFVEKVQSHEVDGLVVVKRLVQPEKPLEVEVGQAVKVDVAGELWEAIVEERLDANRVRLLLSGVGGFKPKRVTARRAQLQSLEPGRQS